jgi:hypothetical protein
VRAKGRGPSLVALEGQGVRWSLSDAPGQAPPLVVQLLGALMDRLMPETGVEIAVVTTVPESALDTHLSALSVALVRALRALPEGEALDRTPETGSAQRRPGSVPTAEIDPAVQEVRAAQSAAGLVTGVAYPLATAATEPEAFAVLDAGTREILALPAPDPLAVGWALVDVSPAWGGYTWVQDDAFYEEQAANVSVVVRHLINAGFPVGALRDLEHATLDAALQSIPERLRPTLRYLVTENRRVQRLIVSIRKADWQMLGALLAMSHGARVKWGEVGEIGASATFVVEQAQALNLSGVFGASITGRGGSVLIVGRPFSLPGALETITEAFRAEYGVDPVTTIL